MNKIIKSLAFVVALGATLLSCNKEIDNPDVPPTENEFVYTLTLVEPEETKAVLGTNESGNFVAQWVNTDKLGVYAKDASQTSIASNTVGDVNVSQKPVTFNITTTSALNNGSSIYAYYPYDAKNNSVAPTAVSLSIPTQQCGDLSSMPMVAEPVSITGDINNNPYAASIKMRNLGSVLLFSIYSSAANYQTEIVKQVRFVTNEKIAGEFNYDITAQDISLDNLNSLSEKSVIVYQEANVGIEKGGNDNGLVPMVVAPNATGYTGSVIVITDKASYTFSISNPLVAERSGIRKVNVNLGSSNCTRADIHRAEFSVNGRVDDNYTQYLLPGEEVVFPTGIAASNDKPFIGWTNSPIDGLVTKEPSLFTNATMESADLNYYAVYGTPAIETYTLDYATDVSSKTLGYGTQVNVTATDGSNWVVKAFKNQGMQINIGKNSSIKIPDCSNNIASIDITCTVAKEIGFSTSDYTGSGSPTYAVTGQESTSQTLDFTNKSLNGGYILPKGGSTAITKIIIYCGSSDSYSSYCTITGADSRLEVNLVSFTADNANLVKGNTIATTITNDRASWTPAYIYSSSNQSVATVDNQGVITAVAKGTATITASLNIDANDENFKKGATSSKSIDITVTNPTHTAQFSVNGSIDENNDCKVEEGASITFPNAISPDEDFAFVGWSKEEITSSTADPASKLVVTRNETMGDSDVIYYAVFGEKMTSVFDAKDITGTPAVKGESLSWADPETGIKLHLSDGQRYTSGTPNTFTVTSGTSNYFEISISDTDSYLSGIETTISSTDYKIGSVNAGSLSISGTTQTVTSVNANSVRCYSTSSKQIRATKIGVFAVRGLCTTISSLPKPTITLSSNTLDLYTDNTDETITLSSNYTGTLEISTTDETVATASLAGNKLNVQSKSKVGMAIITINAPAIDGVCRGQKVAVNVTVNAKQAHGLSFNQSVLNLIIGDTEITKPVLNNPNGLPVVYSLVYETPANEGKVATIDSETGALTLATPSLSTETQGAVAVKAHTDGDNSHAAGDVTYNLVVSRKTPSISWNKVVSTVKIDQDQTEQLPYVVCALPVTYTSSNTSVAIFSGAEMSIVGYGTSTITASCGNNEEYKLASINYTLTVEHHYNVTFKVNGQDDVVLRQETSGGAITAPTVQDRGNYKFYGWAESAVEVETTSTPTLVSLNAGKYTPTSDKIFYAVFKKATGGGGSGSYTLTFGNNANSATGLTASTRATTVISDGTAYVTASPFTVNNGNIYYGDTKTCIRLGKSGNTSSLSIALSEQGKASATTIVVNCDNTGGKNNSNATLSVNGTTAQTTTTSAADYTYTINNDITSITMAASASVRVYSLTVNYGGGGETYYWSNPSVE